MVRTLLIAVFGAAVTFAGGFNLEFGNPAANPDAKAKDAAVVVRAVGCHSPEKAVFTGTASPRKQKNAYSSTREKPSPETPLGLMQMLTICRVASCFASEIQSR